jgi:hypothetical protein
MGYWLDGIMYLAAWLLYSALLLQYYYWATFFILVATDHVPRENKIDVLLLQPSQKLKR